MTDRLGVIREANQAAAFLLRVRKEYLLGKPFPLFVADASRNAFYKRLTRLYQTSEAVRDWEVTLKPSRGDPIEVSLAVAAIPDEHGLAGGLRWSLHDITPAKHTEQALREERNFADVLVKTAQSAIFLIDPRGRVVRANTYLAELSGHSPGDLA